MQIPSTVRGGTKLAAHLGKIAAKLQRGKAVRVGFLEDATYPAQERRADRLMRGLDTLNSTGPFQKGGKPAALRNYRKKLKVRMKTQVGPPAPAKVLHVAQVAFWDEYGSKTSPPRPFFRNMIRDNSGQWGAQLALALKQSGMDGHKALEIMGHNIKDKLVKSIKDWPADNAPLTVAIKGFNKGLIDRGVMERAPDFEVIG